MQNDERQIITSFIERVSGAAPSQMAPGSVPVARPVLPPVDVEADQLLAQLFTRYPEARYRLTQTAFVQEAALTEAQNRINRMEWEMQQSQQQMQAMQAQIAQLQQQAQQPQGGKGFFGGLFGGGSSQNQPQQQRPGFGQQPPYQQMPQQQRGPWGGGQAGPGYAPPPQYGQPQYAPPPQYGQGYQPGMLQRGGSGFLGSALTTAAGVAGGLVVGNALMNMFSGHSAFGGAASSMGGAFGGAAAPGAAAAVDPAAGGGVWANESGFGGDPGAGAAAPDQGGFWGNESFQNDPNQGGFDQGGGGGGDFGGGGGFDDA